MWTVDLNRKEVTRRNWPDPPVEQPKPSTRSLIRSLKAPRQTSNQQIHTIRAKEDFHFRVKPRFDENSARFPELGAIQTRPSRNVRFLRQAHIRSLGLS